MASWAARHQGRPILLMCIQWGWKLQLSGLVRHKLLQDIPPTSSKNDCNVNNVFFLEGQSQQCWQTGGLHVFLPKCDKQG